MPPAAPPVELDSVMENVTESDGMKWFMIIISRISELGMIFGGIPPFIPQYMKLKQSGNAEGFSLYVCFTLIMANVLRIMFWTLKHFETPLLLQSFVMIFTMILLVYAYVKAKSPSEKKDTGNSFQDLFDKELFWQWSHFSSYVYCILLISSLLSLITFIFQSSSIYTETIGFLSVFVEACLGLPQFIRNFKNRSTTGMSVMMVMMWTSGDTFKFFYFLMRDSPMQFSICALLQISLDIAILAQVCYYSSLSKPLTKILPSQLAGLRHTVE